MSSLTETETSTTDDLVERIFCVNIKVIIDSTIAMPAIALPRLSSIPEFEESNSFQSYPLRRSPSYLSFPNISTHLDDISPGRSQINLTFHLLQPDGTVDRATRYEVDRLLKWSHLIGDIERTVGNMGGFHILKIHCEDGRDVRRTIRRGERVWERCSRRREAGKIQECVKIEVVLSSKSSQH
jgi:hypothetical protein